MKVQRRLAAYLTDNGLLWTTCFVLYRILVRIAVTMGDMQPRVKLAAEALDRYMASLEQRHKLPGEYSVRKNRDIYNRTDLVCYPPEWAIGAAEIRSFVDRVMLRYIEPQGIVLEIGPGAGRWTETLQRISKRVIAVDISERVVEQCRQRFSQANNVDIFLNDGRNLSFVPNDSIDFVWSIDVFVHVSWQDAEKYMDEFSRVLKKGGRAVIHHTKKPVWPNQGWRNRMTAATFAEMVERHGFTLVDQFDSWDDGTGEQIHLFDSDIITVFEK